MTRLHPAFQPDRRPTPIPAPERAVAPSAVDVLLRMYELRRTLREAAAVARQVRR